MIDAQITAINSGPTCDVAWKYCAKVADDGFDRAALAPEAKHFVELRIDAKVDGKRFIHESKGTVIVGKDFEKATSVGATAVQVLAYLLSKVNAAQRAKTLEELAAVFEAHEHKLPVTEDDLALAELCMEKLRRTQKSPMKGAVKVSYVTDQPAELARAA